MAFEEFRNMTLGEILSLQAERYPNRSFLKMGDQHWSYQDIEEKANRMAAGLEELGLVAGDRIAIILPNIPSYIVSIFATANSGILFVPINIRRNEEDIFSRLNKTNPKALITGSYPELFDGVDHLEIALSLKEKIPSIEHIILHKGSHPDALDWDSLLDTDGKRKKVEIDPKGPAVIIHTLGSLGEPRGAVLAHRSLARNAISMVRYMEVTPFDVFLGVVPFSNTFGLTATVLACAIAGTQLVCLPKYHPKKALELIPIENITIHHGVPTMFALELNHPDFDSKRCGSLRTGIMAGAPCPPELISRVREEMSMNVLIAYGLTEASPGITITRMNDGPITQTQTVGRVMDDVEVKVIDREGTTLSYDAIGELCARGYNIMQGYWNDPESTAQVLDEEGWLHTGDLATISANGPVRIVGRKGQDVIRAGFKIYPGTIEMKLRSYPGVKDAAVVGVPDLIYGESLYACVVRHQDAKFSAGDLLNFAGEHLPDYATPDRVIFFETLPRRGSGPVDKTYLRERVRVRGYSWKFGKNIDTDAIIPARRCNTADPGELALYCMEDADKDFVNKMKRGDLIVADSNFGCGSSREVAPLTIKAAGVSAVIAKSFARIFFRNAINIGLPILECSEAVDKIQEGDEVEVEPATGKIRNITRGETYKAEPFPDFLQHIIDKGGLLAYVEERLLNEED